MKNAVNSMENLIKVNIEPSLVGNYLEGVTTRVEPMAKATAIITHSIESNPIEKRSAPDKKGDEIVWSCGESQELGGNDLATFGEFNFNMAGTAIGNKVVKMISRFPIAIKRNVRAFVVNVKSLTELGFGKIAKLASIVISLASLRRLLTPVLSFISLNIAFVSPVVGITPKRSTTPNPALKRAILARGFSSVVSKSLSAIGTHLSNQTLIAGVIRTRGNLAAKLQRTLTAASLFDKRPLGEQFTADNARFGLDSANTPALPRAKSGIPAGKFLATNNTFTHNNMIPQLDSIVNR